MTTQKTAPKVSSSTLTKNASQPRPGNHDMQPNPVGKYGGGVAHKFNPPPAHGADGFGHGMHVRSGPLRHSGKAGAHRVGKGK